MSIFSEPVTAERLLRIPKRISQDMQTILLAKNWRDILSAKWNGTALKHIELRSGARLDSPDEVDLLFLFHEVWLDKIYELPGYEVRPGDTVIDIGGNIGAFAIFAAKRSDNIKISSFEPFPQNVEYLRRNITASGINDVRVVEAAVAGETGERFLQVADSWVRHSLSEAQPENGATSGLKVKCISLDDVISETGPCDILKIDCEGGEYEIFYRCKPETLRSIDKMICEYHDGEQGNGRELKEFFEKNSFEVDIFRAFEDTTGLLCVKRKK